MKFTTNGGVHINAAFDSREGLLRIAVRDTGCGVPDKAKGLLFKRFSRVDGSSTRPRSGTGLGLAIAKGLVEAMGGQIGMESQLGIGSEFWFTLPVVAAREAAVSAPQATYDLAGLRALVVDDHPVITELVAARREWVAPDLVPLPF